LTNIDNKIKVLKALMSVPQKLTKPCTLQVLIGLKIIKDYTAIKMFWQYHLKGKLVINFVYGNYNWCIF